MRLPISQKVGKNNPVSYTHLDVYKRQLMHVFSRCSGKRQNRVLSFLNRFRLALN